MRKVISILIFFSTTIPVGLSYGSDAEPGASTPQRLHQQYLTLISDVEVVEGYRMIKVFEVERFWKSVTDSIKVKQSAISGLSAEKIKLHQDVKSLQAEVNKTNESAQALVFASQHIRALGYDIKKSTFLTACLIIAAGLIGIIGLLISFSKSNFKTSREARKLYEELCHEYDQYKHKAIEKQIKLSRELQDHRNKMADLRSA